MKLKLDGRNIFIILLVIISGIVIFSIPKSALDKHSFNERIVAKDSMVDFTIYSTQYSDQNNGKYLVYVDIQIDNDARGSFQFSKFDFIIHSASGETYAPTQVEFPSGTLEKLGSVRDFLVYAVPIDDAADLQLVYSPTWLSVGELGRFDLAPPQ